MSRSALALIALLATPAWATPPELAGLVGAARPAGCVEYRLLIWDLYRAELWSDAPRLPGPRFGLTLTYLSDFSRDELVDSSLDEMTRMSGRPAAAFATARDELRRSFRDVDEGDRITAWRDGPDRVRFFVNGRETGALTADVDLFLGIWLGTATRHPEGREALLSGRCDG